MIRIQIQKIFLLELVQLFELCKNPSLEIGTYKTTPSLLSSLARSPLEGTIPCLEFTIEIQS